MISVKDEAAEVEQLCPKCGSPMVSKMSRYGRFLACSAFPKCKYTETLTKKEEIAGDRKCPKCEASLVVKSGPYGKFLGCSAYPKCDYKESLQAKRRKKRPSGAPQTRSGLKRKKVAEPTDIDCPAGCGGKLIRRRGPRGYFYGCSNFPHCKYTSKSLPTPGQSESDS